jgi:hypothetical protein
MVEESGFALQPSADMRAAQTVSHGGVNPPLPGDVKSPLPGEVESPPHAPWTLPPQGLAVFHGDKDAARLSHYFLPRLLLQGKRVLMLDGANCADPRLLERLARQRRVPFQQFSRQIRIARAFTCFQLTELIARLPRLLTDFPAEVLVVTAFPELYYDEDVRDWNAQVAFEQALANLRRWARSGDFTSGLSKLAAHVIAQRGSAAPTCGKPPAFRPMPQPCSSSTQAGRLSLPACAEEITQNARPSERRSLSASQAAEPQVSVHQIERNLDKGGAAGPKVSATREPLSALTVAVFSSATTFMPSPARRRFFEKVCAAGSEVWQFNSNAEGKLRLVCRSIDNRQSKIVNQVTYGSDSFNISGFDRAGTPELGAGVWPGAAAGGAGVLRGDVQPRAPLHPGLHLRVSRARYGCDQRGRRA